jgi:Universal stress protein family
MKVLIYFDGSDDGFAGLQTVSRLLKSLDGAKEFTLAVAGWSTRPSPIWDRAFEQQGVVDDLHRAMAEVAAQQLDRLRMLFAPIGSVMMEYLVGDPVGEIVALAGRTMPELIVAGVTRGRDARSVSEDTVTVLHHTSIPALLAFGTSATNA